MEVREELLNEAGRFYEVHKVSGCRGIDSSGRIKRCNVSALAYRVAAPGAGRTVLKAQKKRGVTVGNLLTERKKIARKRAPKPAERGRRKRQ